MNDYIDAVRITHLPDCRTPEPFQTIGSRGDRLLRCRACGRFVVLFDPERAPVAAPVEPVVALVAVVVVPAPVVGRYWCPAHPGQVVTWRGTGCPDCAHEGQVYRAARITARARKREVTR